MARRTRRLETVTCRDCNVECSGEQMCPCCVALAATAEPDPEWGTDSAAQQLEGGPR